MRLQLSSGHRGADLPAVAEGHSEPHKEGAAAATAAAAPPYDAILMDFVMPVMDGPTATKAIRAMGYSEPIFGVTGNGMKEDIEHFIAHGATGVLVKPLNQGVFEDQMIATRRATASH